MPPTRRDDPYPAHNFSVIVNGISDGTTVGGAFSEVSGLEVEKNVIEYRNGNEDTTVRKLPGLFTQTNITCKRGVTGDIEFWNWIVSALDGDVVRADGAIVLNDENQVAVMRWEFDRAWPCKYTGPTFNAANNEIGIESFEICCERLRIAT